MDNKIVHKVVVAGLVFGVTVCSSIVANSIYTKNKIGVDKKTLAFGALIGIGLTYALANKLIK